MTADASPPQAPGPADLRTGSPQVGLPPLSIEPPFTGILAACKMRVEAALDAFLPPETEPPERLHSAMRYAVLDGGKRLRAALVYLGGHVGGAPAPALDRAACAVELLHAYSLVHDDLPAMDDDDLRRGKPSCHRAFDEATAILAGDALQSLAFEVLARDVPAGEAGRALGQVAVLAEASGSRGMAGGQQLDLEAEGRTLPRSALDDMHRRKTGALIRASLRMGALAAGAGARTLAALDEYGRCIGLAFQIRDDILDLEGTTEALGKPRGADVARGKSTYPAVLGLERSREAAWSLCREAVAHVRGLGREADALVELAEFIVERTA